MRIVYDYKHWVAAACINDYVYVAKTVWEAQCRLSCPNNLNSYLNSVSRRQAVCQWRWWSVRSNQTWTTVASSPLPLLLNGRHRPSTQRWTSSSMFHVCANICCAAWNCSVCCRLRGFAPRAAGNMRNTLRCMIFTCSHVVIFQFCIFSSAITTSRNHVSFRLWDSARIDSLPRYNSAHIAE